MFRKTFRPPFAKRAPPEDGPPSKKRRLSPEPETQRNVPPPPPARQLPVTGFRARPSTQASAQSQVVPAASTSEAIHFNCLWYARKNLHRDLQLTRTAGEISRPGRTKPGTVTAYSYSKMDTLHCKIWMGRRRDGQHVESGLNRIRTSQWVGKRWK
jgi:hypothetical protein